MRLRILTISSLLLALSCLSVSAVYGKTSEQAPDTGGKQSRENLGGPVSYKKLTSSIQLDRWIDQAEKSYDILVPHLRIISTKPVVPLESIVLYLNDAEDGYATDQYGVSSIPLSRALLDSDAEIWLAPTTIKSLGFNVDLIFTSDASAVTPAQVEAALADYAQFKKTFGFVARQFVPEITAVQVRLTDSDGVCSAANGVGRKGKAGIWEFTLDESASGIRCTATIQTALIA